MTNSILHVMPVFSHEETEPPPHDEDQFTSHCHKCGAWVVHERRDPAPVCTLCLTQVHINIGECWCQPEREAYENGAVLMIHRAEQ